MSKTLYITDLDGTLLNTQSKLSAETIETINRLVAQGELITIATGRSLPSAQPVLEGLHLKLPLVLMNGTVVYDLQQEKYVQVHHFQRPEVAAVVQALEPFETSVFMYAMRDNCFEVFYRKVEDHGNQGDYEIHMDDGDRQYLSHADFHKAALSDPIIYFTMYGPEEELADCFEAVRDIPGVRSKFYGAVYNNNCFLEIYPQTASKATGAAFLKQQLGASEVVAFGDNYNDMELLKWADRAYVTANGVDAAKKVATAVLEHCDAHAVANFIEQDAQLQSENAVIL